MEKINIQLNEASVKAIFIANDFPDVSLNILPVSNECAPFNINSNDCGTLFLNFITSEVNPFIDLSIKDFSQVNFNNNIDLPLSNLKIRDRRKRSDIMRRTSFQARMGKTLDVINRKLLDNSIRLSSHPTDMLRIKTNRDSRSQDVLTRVITDAEVIPIMLPTMKDIPLRKFSLENSTEVLIPSMYPFSDSEYYTLYVPSEIKLDEDDLLIRLVYEAYSDEPYIMALQVKDILSNVGYNSIIYSKIQVTFYDEPLPDPVISLIKEANKKRELLGW